MALTRKIRKVGNSLMVAIPAQLAEMAGIRAGDSLEFEYLGKGILRIAKASDERVTA